MLITIKALKHSWIDFFVIKGDLQLSRISVDKKFKQMLTKHKFAQLHKKKIKITKNKRAAIINKYSSINNTQQNI